MKPESHKNKKSQVSMETVFIYSVVIIILLIFTSLYVTYFGFPFAKESEEKSIEEKGCEDFCKTQNASCRIVNYHTFRFKCVEFSKFEYENENLTVKKLGENEYTIEVKK